MAPTHSCSSAAMLSGDEYPTLALSLIRIYGYREPDPDLLDEIIRDALDAAEADEHTTTAPTDPATLGHLDRSVRAAAAAGQLRRD